MLAAWRERCPIYLALRDPNEVTVTTEIASRVASSSRAGAVSLGLRPNAVIPATLPDLTAERGCGRG